ncbi:hypothetical protein [Parasitella parasitica]|uniref:Fumarylacetoacetase-like C-terminal domain-containing protein n=1 Tax=Parasitella parasitica TaxID=35722 RepID=A0A0B7NAB3_9FUNG|nr:hypothetical protein [Parasitella parasitica]
MAETFLTTGRKIVAIGRNYRYVATRSINDAWETKCGTLVHSEHAKELNNAVPETPFFFLKPTSSYLENGNDIELPQGCEVHHEIELAVVIGKDGRDIAAAEADDYIAGYALAIDLTARDLQLAAKKKGLPWSASKGFDTFTPISGFIEKERIADPANVNGEYRQNGNTKDMIFSIPTLIAHVSSIMKLQVGDVILTGTPKGVSAIQTGDVVTGGLETEQGQHIMDIKFNVVQRKGGFINDEAKA